MAVSIMYYVHLLVQEMTVTIMDYIYLTCTDKLHIGWYVWYIPIQLSTCIMFYVYLLVQEMLVTIMVYIYLTCTDKPHIGWSVLYIHIQIPTYYTLHIYKRSARFWNVNKGSYACLRFEASGYKLTACCQS